MDIWEKSILIQGNIKCKGLEVLNMFKTEKEANEGRLVKGRVVVNQAREVAKSQTAEGFGGWSKNFVFFYLVVCNGKPLECFDLWIDSVRLTFYKHAYGCGGVGNKVQRLRVEAGRPDRRSLYQSK